jgi:hypothetical protein
VRLANDVLEPEDEDKILRYIVALCALIAASSPTQARHGDPEFVPEDGFVPDADTATKIAEVILTRIYGADEVALERPWVTKLSDGTWTVKGTLPKRLLGGSAEIEISKKDGRVLYLSHGR